MNRKHFLVFIFLLSLISGCLPGEHEGNKAIQQLSNREKIKFNQYMVHGKQLYQTHCSNCHLEDGTGVARLIPPLKNSSYLVQNIEKSICLTKYGIDGPMEVSGQTYDHPMPANEKLTPLEIAEIITYVSNAWGNTGGFITVTEVESVLEKCKQNPMDN